MSDLDYRYGRRARRRWVWVLAAVIALAAAVTWAAWAGFRPKDVNAVLYGYRVVDDHRVQVELIVHRRTPIDATCTVYAQAEDHSTVGERQVQIDADDPLDGRVHAVITTERRAVNGVLRGCDKTEK